MAVKRKNQQTNTNKEQNGEDSLFDLLNPNKVISNAQKVINSAVGVLEEEIAAGILAAKKIEKKVIDVNEVRSNDQDLINRIRHDMHEALDIFVDGFAALSRQIGLLTEKVNTENGKPANGTAEAPKAFNPVQVIEHEDKFLPGQTVQFSLLLKDDALKETTELSIHNSDFLGLSGQRIPSRHTHIKPTQIILEPGQEIEVSVLVKLPGHCPAGQYNSILTIKEMPRVKIILCFQVT